MFLFILFFGRRMTAKILQNNVVNSSVSALNMTETLIMSESCSIWKSIIIGFLNVQFNEHVMELFCHSCNVPKVCAKFSMSSIVLLKKYVTL